MQKNIVSFIITEVNVTLDIDMNFRGYYKNSHMLQKLCLGTSHKKLVLFSVRNYSSSNAGFIKIYIKPLCCNRSQNTSHFLTVATALTGAMAQILKKTKD